MNVGKLKNEALLSEYKKLGYATRTEMIDQALELMKRKIARREREQWVLQAAEEYSGTRVENVFEDIEGEDFAE
jgi:hypothetical protein